MSLSYSGASIFEINTVNIIQFVIVWDVMPNIIIVTDVSKKWYLINDTLYIIMNLVC